MTSGASEDHSTTQPQEGGHFKRALGLVDAIAIVVGSMIGSGIFIVSAETARHVGSASMLLVCWVLAGLLTIAAALCYSELSSMFPKAGGQYVFLREAYGPLWGFLYGWTLFMVIQSGTIAAVGVAFAKFLGVFIPSVSNSNVLLAIGHWKLSVLQLISVALIVLLTWINCRGIEAGKRIQTSFTLIKVAALIGLIVLGLLSFDKFQGLAANFSIKNFFLSIDDSGQILTGIPLILAIGWAMTGPLFSCDAWNNITFAGEEVKDAPRILPKSLAFGTLLVVIIYVLANVCYLLLIPLHGNAHADTIAGRGIMFAAEDRIGTAAADVIFGATGNWIMAGAIMISTFGCLNGLILAGARVYFAMAKDGLFFAKAGVLNATTNVPKFGLIVQAVWSCILATSGSYNELLDFVMFTTLLFYLGTVSAVFVLRAKHPSLERPYRVPFYPILPALYLVATLGIMLGQLVGAPMRTLLGLGIVLLGLPVYFYWRRKMKAVQ